MVLFCRRMDFWFAVRDCGGLCFMPTTEDVWHNVPILIDGLILAVRRLFMSILVWMLIVFHQHQTNKTVSSCFVYFYVLILPGFMLIVSRFCTARKNHCPINSDIAKQFLVMSDIFADNIRKFSFGPQSEFILFSDIGISISSTQTKHFTNRTRITYWTKSIQSLKKCYELNM